jgi:long-chain acyl-CoA synthetase
MAVANANIEGANDFLADGEVGELVVRGPNVMQGYYKRDEANKTTIVDGWLHTGDLGYRDAEGYFYISGPQKRNDHSGW